MPVDQPLWLKSGVVSGGRNVFIVACLTSRGNKISPPPSVCRAEMTVSRRVNESKLVSVDLRLAGQALHRRRDVAELKVLGEERRGRASSGPRTEKRGSKPRMPLNDLRNRGTQIARLDLPVVGAAPGANLRDAGREAAVFGGERIGQHFDRFDALRRQIEIEVAGRGIDRGWRC